MGNYLIFVKRERWSISNSVEANQRVLVVSTSFKNFAVVFLESQFVGAVPVILHNRTRVEDNQFVANETKLQIVFLRGKKNFGRIEKQKSSLPKV